VTYPLVERNGVDALRDDYALQRSHRGSQQRPQGLGLFWSELSQRFTMPPGLDDQLPRVGVGPGVVADEPEPSSTITPPGAARSPATSAHALHHSAGTDVGLIR